MQSDVLIIGAGPTGLVLALWLTKLGVRVRIVDKTTEPGTTSRALAVQARTLELYRQLDLADAVVEHGHKVPAVNLWVKGTGATSFQGVGEDLTPSLPGDLPTGSARAAADRTAGEVRRQWSAAGLMRFTDEAARHPRSRPGGKKGCGQPTAGSDGAPGAPDPAPALGTYRQVFYVADVEAARSLHERRTMPTSTKPTSSLSPRRAGGSSDLPYGTSADHAETLKLRMSAAGRSIASRSKSKVVVLDLSHPSSGPSTRKGRAFCRRRRAYPSPAGGQGANTGTAARHQSGLKSQCWPRRRQFDTYEAERTALPSGLWRQPIAFSVSPPPRGGSPKSCARA